MTQDGTRPFSQGGTPTQAQMEAFAKLASVMRGTQKQEYVPVLKALEFVGVNYRVIDVTIGGEAVESVVIPVDELMYKEWAFMSGKQQKGEDQ